MNKQKLEEDLVLLEIKDSRIPYMERERMREHCFKEILKVEDLIERAKYMGRYWVLK